MNRTETLDRLWAFQQKHGYLTDDFVADVAAELGISEIELDGVISFYHFFSRKPIGRHTIYLNNSIVSECKGFDRVRVAFEREIGAVTGQVDPSGQFGLFQTACIGLSDQEPAALIDFHPFTGLNTMRVRRIVNQLKKGADAASICDDVSHHVQQAPRADGRILFRDYHPGAAVWKLGRLGRDGVLSRIKRARITGMGGAFFPVWAKWDACRQQPGNIKYIVCNADEGEPGTFKDRVLLQQMPGLVLEGMICAGFAVGASEGIIYLRAEYSWLLPLLQVTLEDFRHRGLLGEKVGGIDDFGFDVRVQLGAGSYVCGEETALLNSMEGKRGEPRTKQYFPTERGFLGKPTVVNNVETLCVAARVLELGADALLQTGTSTSPGTKLLSISGDCHKPGVYEIEWGTPVSDVLEWCGADDPYYLQLSGPAGQCVSPAEFDRCLALDDLRCGGSFMVFNSQRDILSILRNYSGFFRHESCGLCTPCRAGNFLIERKLEKVSRGLAYVSDYEDIKQWGRIIRKTSRCGLGKTSTTSLCMSLDKFPEYFAKRVDKDGKGMSKKFDLEAAIGPYEKFRD